MHVALAKMNLRLWSNSLGVLLSGWGRYRLSKDCIRALQMSSTQSAKVAAIPASRPLEMLYVNGMMVMVAKAGKASWMFSQLMKRAVLTIRHPTTISAGPGMVFGQVVCGCGSPIGVTAPPAVHRRQQQQQYGVHQQERKGRDRQFGSIRK